MAPKQDFRLSKQYALGCDLYLDFQDMMVPVGRGIEIFVRAAGNGPPLLLLHGYPQNQLIWHRMTKDLTKAYTVVMMDLRGYGCSSKPAGDDKHEKYSKRVMAKDCTTVIKEMFGDRQDFYICAHDRGARVAHRLLIDYPKRVRKAIFLDICPTLAMYNQTNFDFAKAYYHWFFLIQPNPLPETLINGNAKTFLEENMGKRHPGGLKKFDPEVFKAYVSMMEDPNTVHATCEDYRASASIDLEHHREDDKKARKIDCPLKVIWGSQGVIEHGFDAIREWQDVSNSEVTGHSLDCGHYIPEEQPEALVKTILEFFDE